MMTCRIPVSSLAALALCAAASTAGAVHRSMDGIGQALIYPYYTVRSVEAKPFNTYVTVTNRNADVKAIRVRFREGRNGREVAGFNLFLGSRETWSAVVVPTATGARLVSADGPCTEPALATGGTQAGTSFIDFSAAAYSGANDDGAGTGPDRLREGYVEMLEMATVAGTSPGVTPTCAEIRASPGALRTAAPTGGLLGTLTLINVADGTNFAVVAEALGGLSTRPFYRAAADPYPDFDAVEIDRVGILVTNDKMYRADLASPIAAIDFALARTFLENEVILDAATRSETDWIVTLPTRRFHPGSNPAAPFSAAMKFSLSFRGRDVDTTPLRAGCGDESPCPNLALDLHWPWAATVLNLYKSVPAASGAGTSRALGSTNAWLVGLPTSAENGWLSLLLSSTGVWKMSAQTTSLVDGAVAQEYLAISGLPAVGFMVRTLRNGTLQCGASTCQGNYGGAFPHRSRTQPTPTN
jgi:hypothetical protein